MEIIKKILFNKIAWIISILSAIFSGIFTNDICKMLMIGGLPGNHFGNSIFSSDPSLFIPIVTLFFVYSTVCIICLKIKRLLFIPVIILILLGIRINYAFIEFRKLENNIMITQDKYYKDISIELLNWLANWNKLIKLEERSVYRIQEKIMKKNISNLPIQFGDKLKIFIEDINIRNSVNFYDIDVYFRVKHDSTSYQGSTTVGGLHRTITFFFLESSFDEALNTEQIILHSKYVEQQRREHSINEANGRFIDDLRRKGFILPNGSIDVEKLKEDGYVLSMTDGEMHLVSIEEDEKNNRAILESLRRDSSEPIILPEVRIQQGTIPPAFFDNILINSTEENIE